LAPEFYVQPHEVELNVKLGHGARKAFPEDKPEVNACAFEPLQRPEHLAVPVIGADRLLVEKHLRTGREAFRKRPVVEVLENRDDKVFRLPVGLTVDLIEILACVLKIDSARLSSGGHRRSV
jgi:hypothetical protein